MSNLKLDNYYIEERIYGLHHAGVAPATLETVYQHFEMFGGIESRVQNRFQIVAVLNGLRSLRILVCVKKESGLNDTGMFGRSS